MSFAAPIALFLLAPLAVLIGLSRSSRISVMARLPGAWARVVAPDFRSIVAARSDTAVAAFSPSSILLGVLIVVALARPGLDTAEPEDFATLSGRVVVMDVGADLARHRQFLDDLHRADPSTAIAVVAVSGDAYRITPFTADKAYLDRYVRVLNADVMPRSGHRPHLGIARAEQLLDQAGYLVRQIVFLTARTPPEQTIAIPGTDTRRALVNLDETHGWDDWASEQGADVAKRGAAADIAADLSAAALKAARSELPAARLEITPFLVMLAAALWLLKFRRRAE